VKYLTGVTPEAKKLLEKRQKEEFKTIKERLKEKGREIERKRKKKEKTIRRVHKALAKRMKRKRVLRKVPRATYKIPEEKPVEYRSIFFQREYAKEKNNLLKEGRK